MWALHLTPSLGFHRRVTHVSPWMLVRSCRDRPDAPSAGLFAASRASAAGNGGYSGGAMMDTDTDSRADGSGAAAMESTSRVPQARVAQPRLPQSRVPQSRITVPGPARSQPVAHQVHNVRKGIFGTALEEEDDVIDNGRDLDDQVAPAMNGFGGGRGFGSGGGVGLRSAAPPREDVTFQVPFNSCRLTA